MADKALVVGGGVVGAACAHFLQTSGWQVTVIDKAGFGQACSHGNCGLIVPSHILPLAEPGAIAAALKALFQRDSPFYIKPRLDASLWAWLVRFALRSNHRDMLDSARAIHALLESSMKLYPRLIEQESFDCEWERHGLLFAYRTRRRYDAYAKSDRILREEFGVPARRVDGDLMLELEPALKAGLAGGWYYEDDAHLRPDKLLASWKRSLEARGVTIIEHCRFDGFAKTNGRALRADTSQGQMEADIFVVAAGALMPLLAQALGVSLPIQPGKGYSITMPRPSICPRIPMIFPEDSVAVTPMRSGYRLGSTMEFAGYDPTLNHRRLEILKIRSEPYLREPHCEPITERWYGWRPMTYDGKPVIDRAPGLENVFIAAGHNMLGMSMAPATGKLLAELVNGEPPHIDPVPLSVARFR